MVCRNHSNGFSSSNQEYVLLFLNVVQGQSDEVELSADLIPSYYIHDYADLLDYSYFDGTTAKKFVLFHSVNMDYMISKNVGFQVGFQQHNINLVII